MGDRRKCQTYAASPAEPGGLPIMLARTARPVAARRASQRHLTSIPQVELWNCYQVMYDTRLERQQLIERMLWPHQYAKLSQLAAGSRRQGP